MFPDTNHSPSAPAQRAGDEPIAGLVGRNLLSPERRIAPRLDEMSRTPMPEAPIDEHRQLPIREHEVRLPEHRPMPPPARDPVCPKDRDQSQLGVLVTRSADAGHHLRPLGFGESIRYGV